VSDKMMARNQQGGTVQHLDEMTCLLYIERQLDRARGLEVSAHTQECPECRTLLRALERESRLLTRALFEEDEPMPARLAQFQERARKSMQWVWGIVVGLAATGVYALYTSYVAPWQQQLEQAGFGGTNLLGLLFFQGAFWKGWQSMATLLEMLALVTLAGFAMLMLRRRSRRGYVVAMLLAALLGSGVLLSAASATEFRKGTPIETVRSDEVIHGDLYITADRGRVDGTVEGDVFIFAQSAEITGHVQGDVISFAGQTKVSGRVDGNVRCFTNSVTITGTVGKNVMAFADNVDLEAVGKIGGSFTGFSSSESLDGQIGTDVLAFAHNLEINGKILGSVLVKGDSFTVGPHGEVAGHVKYEGVKQPEVSPQAKLASPVEFKKREHQTENTLSHYIWQLIWAAAFVLFGLVLFLLMPEFSRRSVANTERYGASFGLGVLVGIGVPIAAVIACVTVVGLFVGVSALFIWYAALYAAQVMVGGLVGQWLLGRTNELWPLIGRMVLGVLLVRLCTAVPEVGSFIKYFLVVPWGLGAISLSIYQRFAPVMAPPPGGPAPSPYVPPPLPPNTTVGGIQSA
jgi:cytoskeletal protein CcmA (bactofilin family)